MAASQVESREAGEGVWGLSGQGQDGGREPVPAPASALLSPLALGALRSCGNQVAWVAGGQAAEVPGGF